MSNKSALRLFRILIAFFLVISFITFREADEVINVFGMLMTVMLGISFICVELLHYTEKK